VKVSIRYGLLALLKREPMHGYQLRSEFETATGATWHLNIGQVYTTLHRLERDGLVVASEADRPDGGGDDRRRYQLTEAGSEELDAWFNSAVSRHASARSELVVKVVMATSLDSVDAVTVIDAERVSIMETLQAITRAKAAMADLPAALAADAVVFSSEAEIRWLDHCQAHLSGRKRKATTKP
jgi:DNA-binding PadR family transcriptional regulator